MFKRSFLCASLLMLPAASAGDAQSGPAPTVNLPGTGYEVSIGSTAFEPGSTRVKPELLRAIVGWLSSNYDLGPADELPGVAFVSHEVMIALRHRDVPTRGLLAGEDAFDQQGAPHSSMVVAVYDDADRTIYLPEAWTGSTPFELSVLVHEMVHHLQNMARMTFACSEEREQLAYAAQRDWLALFGRDLFSDLGIDAFTLLVQTHCVY